MSRWCDQSIHNVGHSDVASGSLWGRLTVPDSRRGNHPGPAFRGASAQADPMRASGGQLIVSADGQSLEDHGHATGVCFKYVSDRCRLRQCQIASNSDPLFASNIDPSSGTIRSLSTSCIGGTRARSAAPQALRGAKGAGGSCASRGSKREELGQSRPKPLARRTIARSSLRSEFADRAQRFGGRAVLKISGRLSSQAMNSTCSLTRPVTWSVHRRARLR